MQPRQKLGIVVKEIEEITADPALNPREEEDRELAQEYGEIYYKRGLSALPPVTVFFDGKSCWLADGFLRHAGALMVGLRNINADIREGTRRDALLYSAGANAKHGKRRTNADKRRSVLKLLTDPKKEWVLWSDQVIAQHCQVDPKTVGNYRRELAALKGETSPIQNGQVSQGNPGATLEIPEWRKGADGRTINVSSIGRHSLAAPTPLSQVLPSATIPPSPETLARADLPYKDTPLSSWESRAVGYIGGQQSVIHLAHEWLTPPDILSRVERVLGTIDLDPCADSKTTPNVKAATLYTVEDDGLSKTWQGKVFMNPPHHTIGAWVEKLMVEYQAGHVTEAIALLPARPDVAWFRLLREHPRCFLSTRLKVTTLEGTVVTAPRPSSAVYLGRDLAGFARAFQDIGDIFILFKAS